VRPCICERVTSDVYDLSQCRACWLYRHDPAYRQLWDAPAGPGETPPAPPARPNDCVHLGRVLDRMGRTCPGCWVRECERYGRCAVGWDMPAGVRSCQDCPDYQSDRVPEDKWPTESGGGDGLTALRPTVAWP
jgi:hypothetical protein